MACPEPFTSTAPGRLCLFGEHQDYLGMPVIAAALPLRCRIEVTPMPERVLEMCIPALGTTWRCDLSALPPNAYRKEDGKPDFAMAAVLDAMSDGWSFVCGAKCLSTTDIPLQAGCSSSSAFVVSWINVLARLAGKKLSPLELAKRAHQAEVLHFGAPGGTMDHVTSAFGGVLRIGPGKWDIDPLPCSHIQGVWVLADSGQPKDTMGHLKRCKGDRLALLERLGGHWDADATDLTDDEMQLLKATRTNRDTETNAAAKWPLDEPSGPELGEMMDLHHMALRDGLGLSTPRLEAMRQAASDAGSWGFKVVGSGGGGCAVAWAPNDRADAVAEAMMDIGAVAAWEILVAMPGNGATIENS